MCSSKKELAQCCALYSVTGIVFMSWVGIMLMKQPFFVGGIENVDQSTGNAFGAAAVFFFIFVISMVHLIMDTMKHPSNPAAAASFSRSSSHSMSAQDSFEGWAGQRNSEFRQVPPTTTYQDDPDGSTERVGFLS